MGKEPLFKDEYEANFGDKTDYSIPAKERVNRIMKILVEGGFEAYIIGGAVRDTLLGEVPKDYDIFTNAEPDFIETTWKDNFKVIGGETRQKKVLTYLVDGIEVSRFRKDGKREDPTGTDLFQHLLTCDFTINAIAMDYEGKVIDAVGGYYDLLEGTLRAVGNPYDRFEEDRLRVMRAVRFMAKYGFRPDEELVKAIRTTPIMTLPVERIREEFLKIIAHPAGPRLLDQLGIMDQIFPEWQTMRMDGGPYHNETVDEHSFIAHELMCRNTGNILLIFTALFHDIGKPISATRKDTRNGKLVDPYFTFVGHEKTGAEKIGEIMERLKFSNNDVKYVKRLVREHQYPLKERPVKNFKGYHALFGKLEEDKVPINDLVLLRYCDRQANLKLPPQFLMDFLDKYEAADAYFLMKLMNVPFTVKDLAINGNDIMEIGFPAGPQVGAELAYLYKAVVDGGISNDRVTLLRMARQRYKKNNT